MIKAVFAFWFLIALLCLVLSGCGASQLDKETATEACREYTNIWGVSGRYVAYNSIGDWYMCYSQSGDELRLFDGDYIRERKRSKLEGE